MHVAGAKRRMGAAKVSLSAGAIAGDGAALGGFASWRLRISLIKLAYPPSATINGAVGLPTSVFMGIPE